MNEISDYKRTVRSFVRRTGRLTPSQARALADLWPRYGLDYVGSPRDLEQAFDRAAPVVLEIGFGNGESLVAQAAADPVTNFLGIEVHEPGIGHALLKARDATIDNLRVMAHDAVQVLRHELVSNSLARLNLYFPDPWPKKRHHKRRIVQDDFLDLVAERLQDRGTLHIATDWTNYAVHIDDCLARSQQFTIVERREHAGDRPYDRPGTKFEARGLRHGHRIVDWCCEKVS